jgi:hypothetical protein
MIVIISILCSAMIGVHLQTLKRARALADARQAYMYARSGAEAIAMYIGNAYGPAQPMTAKNLATLNTYTNPYVNIGKGKVSVVVQGSTITKTNYTELLVQATGQYRQQVGSAKISVHYRADTGTFYTGAPPDVTPPSAPIVNKVTKNDSTVTGTAEANSQIVITVGSQTIGTGVTTAAGNFSVAISQQSKGVVLSVTAQDAAGNVSVATKITVTN